MKVRVWGSSPRVEELMKKGFDDHEVRVNGSEEPDTAECYDLFIDLDFDEGESPGSLWISQVHDKPFLLSTVCTTLGSLPVSDARLIGMNCWSTCIERPVAELSLKDPRRQNDLQSLMRQLGWKYSLVPDQIGMVTPRVIAMIINEAYFAFGDGVSGREDIDVAMRLGTHYPYGPFEWAKIIGVAAVCKLLKALHSRTGDDRYLPAPLLEEESKTPKFLLP